MTDIQITLYSKPNCQQCKMTARHLDKQGTEYVYRDVTEDEAAFDEVRILGYQALPVVVAGDMHWFGYRPDRIKALQSITASDVAEHESDAENYLEEVGFGE